MLKRILAFILTALMIMIISACDIDIGLSSKTEKNNEGSAGNIDSAGTSSRAEQGDTQARDTAVAKGETAEDGMVDSDQISHTGSNKKESNSPDSGAINGDISDRPEAGEEPLSKTDQKADTATETMVKKEPGAVDDKGSKAGTEAAAEAKPEANEKTGSETEPEAAGKTGVKTETISENAGNSSGPNDTGTDEAQGKILEGRIICIDPGHQSRGNYDTEPVAPGSDEMKAKVSSGTAGVKTRIPEYRLVLEVSLKLRDALEGYGATVIMTRTVNDVDISNAERAAIANDANADLYLRIHADGSTDKSVHGVSVLIPGNKYITDKYILKESEKAGGSILNSFVKATGAKSRGLSVRSDLSGFNWCRVPMALIELGFMSNTEEDVKLNSEEYQTRMVEGMTNGIVDYFMSK